MDEPASLFDLGMQRLPPNIDMFDGFYQSGSDNTRAWLDLNWWYDRDANQIVGAMSVWDSDSDGAAMEAGCSEALNQLNQWVSKSIPMIFMHQGWHWDDYDDETRALDAELRGMFILYCTVYGNSTEDVRFDAQKELGEKMLVQ